MGLIPIDLYLLGEALKGRLRLRNYSKIWDGVGYTLQSTGHQQLLDNHLEYILRGRKVQRKCTLVNWLRPVTVVNPDIIVFSDGASNETSNGLGWVALNPDGNTIQIVEKSQKKVLKNFFPQLYLLLISPQKVTYFYGP